MGAGSNSNKWKMFLLFGEFFMLFNDKKLTMYTSSKKRLDFKFIPCISLHRLSTENSRYIYWKYHFTGKKKKKLTGSVAIMLMLYLSMDQIVTCPNIAAWEEVLFLLCLKNLVWSLIFNFYAVVQMFHWFEVFQKSQIFTVLCFGWFYKLNIKFKPVWKWKE